MKTSTRAINMEKRRQRILAVARTTIARDGVDGLTVRRLASEAGITVPTIYNLIGNKDDLLRRLLDELVSRAEDALAAVEGDEPIDATEHSLAVWSTVCVAYSLLREVLQAWAMRRMGLLTVLLRDGWNWLDWLWVACSLPTVAIVFSADDGFRPVFLSRSTRSFVPSGVSVCSTRATLWPLATRASTYLP